MSVRKKLAAWAIMPLFLATGLRGQSLAPRAYIITPLGSNAFTITTNIYTGGIQLNNTIPITGASGTAALFIPSYYRSLNLFGRSANITLVVPYVVGTFDGFVVNQPQHIYRSGLGDGAVRFSVNLKGGPAMKLAEFMKWRQKRLLGVSFLTQFPTGQYDPTKLINIGINRWAFKPEIGYSERRSNWMLDVYGAAWFFTSNPDFFSHNSYFLGTRQQTQQSIAAIESHLSRDFKPGTWVSVDGNFWYGGRTSLNGVPSPNTLQRNSRVGATAAFRINEHQSLKIGFSAGAHIRFGGDFQAVAVGWQYAWLNRHSTK